MREGSDRTTPTRLDPRLEGSGRAGSLAKDVVSPAFHAAIRVDTTGVVVACAHAVEGAGGGDGLAEVVGLAAVVAAPALDTAIRLDAAGVAVACTHTLEGAGRGAGLSVVVTAPALYAAAARDTAGVGVAAYPDYSTALQQVVEVGHEFQPDGRAHAAYNQLFPIYKELYPDVKPYFERLAHLDLPKVWVTRRD